MARGSQRLNSDWQRHNRSLKAWNQNVARWSRWIVPRLFSRRDYIFVTSLPKSGSTLLTNILVRITKYFPHPLCDHPLHEQNLVHTRLIDSWAYKSIATHHTLATDLNVERLRSFEIRPVVLVRDIFDAAVSLRDHLERESPITSTFVPPPGYEGLSDQEKLDAIIALGLPWHLSFVAGWQAAPLPVLFIRYEDLIAEPVPTLARILKFVGRDDPPGKIEAAWDDAQVDADTRRNIGRPGRGDAAFTAAQREAVHALTRNYPDADFSIIGL